MYQFCIRLSGLLITLVGISSAFDVEMPLRQSRLASRPAPTAPTSRPSVASMSFPLSPPLFNGHDGSFTRFKTDFNIFAQLNAWSDQEKLLYLPLCLTGLARDAYEALDVSQRVSYSATIEALSHSFTPIGVVEAHARLQALKFDPAESLEPFLIRFKAAVRAAFPSDNSDHLLFTYFLSSLPLNYRAEVISAGCDSFHQAVSKTKCLLAARRATTTAVAEPSVIGVRRIDDQGSLEQLLSRIEALEAKLDQVSSLPQPASAGGTSGPCFACGRSGHIRSACRYSRATCHGCGKTGHIKPACRSKNAQSGGAECSTTRATSGSTTRM